LLNILHFDILCSNAVRLLCLKLLQFIFIVALSCNAITDCNHLSCAGCFFCWLWSLIESPAFISHPILFRSDGRWGQETRSNTTTNEKNTLYNSFRLHSAVISASSDVLKEMVTSDFLKIFAGKFVSSKPFGLINLAESSKSNLLSTYTTSERFSPESNLPKLKLRLNLLNHPCYYEYTNVLFIVIISLEMDYIMYYFLVLVFFHFLLVVPSLSLFLLIQTTLVIIYLIESLCMLWII